jgi:Transposase IS66 family
LNTAALERIGALYRIEETIRGKPPDERRAHRQEHARPLLDRFHAWLTTTLETLSRKSDTSQAILYALNRWEALTRYCDDGQLEIDNLPVERALRGVAIGRRTICLLEQTLAANVPLPSIASLVPQNSTASILRPICATCSHASPTMRLTASTNSPRG